VQRLVDLISFAIRRVVGRILCVVSRTGSGKVSECPGHPDPLGTTRVIALDPDQYSRVGTAQYQKTLPLNDREVVLTFDDGPLPPYTTRILDTLASNGVRATFFIVGSMAHRNPELVRRAYKEGHTIGTHTENHLLNIASLPIEQTKREVETGIVSVTKALGNSAVPAPFFRFPALGRTEAAEKYLRSRNIVTWSADVIPDDWSEISPERVVERSLDGLKRQGRGILLLHDIHKRTAEALPILLGRLKSEGFHIVHVVAAES